MALKYSLGFDLGTTTVASVLIDNVKNAVIGQKSVLNLQYPDLGTDSIKRIQSGLDDISVIKLQEKAILTLNLLIEHFENNFNINPGEVGWIAIAGNTVMEMALCGYPLICMSKPPYKPTSDIIFPKKSNELHFLDAKNARLFIFPVLSGFVGGDVVSSIYYLNIHKSGKPVFFADFGTNVEIVIGNKDKIFTTSAPAGPAFEGGNIRFGMTAKDSAIYSIDLKNGVFGINTIGSRTPEGICGSGIIDLIASLLREKIIDKNGRILPPELIDTESYSVVVPEKDGNQNEIVVYRDSITDIRFYQDDVRQFQFAKSAVKSAAEIILEKFKLSVEDDFDVYISGSFGSYIKPENVDIVDIFPFKGKNIGFIMDSVLLGCGKYLLSSKGGRKKDISVIMDISKNFPFSGSKLFEKHFIKNMVWQ